MPIKGFKEFMRRKSSKSPLAIVGSDLDLISELETDGRQIVGYFSLSDKNNGYQYLGNHKKVENLSQEVKLLIAADNPEFREFIFKSHRSRIESYVSLTSNVISKDRIPEGCVIYANSFISSSAILGQGVKVSVGAQIHHQTRVEEFSVIGPRSLLLGECLIRKRTFVGAAAAIHPKVTIGNDSYIGMMANVIKSFDYKCKLVGNPARDIELYDEVGKR